jgi:DHA2 family multidrug resistance protein
MTALGSVLYGLTFVLPVFMSSILGFTAQQTGELFIPGSIGCAMMMPLIGMALRKLDPRQLIFTGFAMLACAAIYISRFDADASTQSMFWPLFYRGLAMSFIFVPINSTVLTQFTGAAIGQASGLLNLSRQLGGSVAIAILSTLLAQNQDRAYAYMAGHVTWFDPAAYSSFRGALGMAHAKLANTIGMGAASLQATKLLVGRAKKQAFILAYQKTLSVVVMMFTLALIPLMNLKGSRKLAPGEKLPDAH